jgi:hypothetical protein
MLLFIGLLIVLCIGVLTYSKWSSWIDRFLPSEGFQSGTISYQGLLDIDKENFNIELQDYSKYNIAYTNLYRAAGPAYSAGPLYQVKTPDSRFRTSYTEILFLDQVRQKILTLLEYIKPDLPNKLNYFSLPECYRIQQSDYSQFLQASDWLKKNGFAYMNHRLVWSRLASPEKWDTLVRLRRELRRIQLRYEMIKSWISVKKPSLNEDQLLDSNPLSYGPAPPPSEANLASLTWIPSTACLRQYVNADEAKESLILNQFWWSPELEAIYITKLAGLSEKYKTLSSYNTRAIFAYQCRKTDWDTYSDTINARLNAQILREEESLKTYYQQTEPLRNKITTGLDFATSYLIKYECLDFDYNYYYVYLNFLSGDPENSDINYINILLLQKNPPIQNIFTLPSVILQSSDTVLLKLKESIQKYLSYSKPTFSLKQSDSFGYPYQGTITTIQKEEIWKASEFASRFSLSDEKTLSNYIRVSRFTNYKDMFLSNGEPTAATEVMCPFIKRNATSTQCQFDISQAFVENSRFATFENPNFSKNSGQCDELLTAELFSLLPTATRNFLQQVIVNQVRRLLEYYKIQTRPFVFLGQDKTLEAQIMLNRGQSSALRNLFMLAQDIKFQLPEGSLLAGQLDREIQATQAMLRTAPAAGAGTTLSFDINPYGISYFFPKPTPVDFSRTIYLNALAQKFYQELGGRFAITQIYDVSTLGSSIVDMRFDVAYHGSPLELYEQIQAVKANYEKFRSTIVTSDVEEDARISFFNKLYDLQQAQDENIEKVFTGLHGRFFYHLENGVFIVDGFTLDRKAVTSYLPSANGGLPVAQFSQPGNVSYSPTIQYTYNITPQMDCTTLEGVKAILAEYRDIIYTDKVKRQITNPKDGGYAWDLSGQLWIKQILSSQKLNDNQCAIKWVESVIDRGLNAEVTQPVNRKDITRRAIFTQVKNTDQWFATDLTMDLSGFYFLPADSGGECRIEAGRSNAYRAGESPCPSVNINAKFSPFVYGALNPSLYTTVGRNLTLLKEDYEKTQLVGTPTTRRLLAPAWDLTGSGATVFNQSLPQPLPQEFDLDTRDDRCPPRSCKNPRALYEIMSAWNNSDDPRVTGKILRVTRAVTANPGRCDLEYEIERNGAVTTESRRFIVGHALPSCILQIDFDKTFQAQAEGFQSAGSSSTPPPTNALFLRGAPLLADPVEYTTEFVKGTFSDADLGEASKIVADTASGALATIQPALANYKTTTDQLKTAIQTDVVQQISEREVSVTSGEVNTNLFTKIRITFFTARELGTRIGLRYIFLHQGTGFLDLYLSKIVANGYTEESTNKLRPFDFESQAAYDDIDAVYFNLPVTLEVELDRGYIVDGFSFMTGPNSEEDPVEWEIKGVTADNKIITLQSMKMDIQTAADFSRIKDEALKRFIPSNYYSLKLNSTINDYNTNYSTYTTASTNAYKPIQDLIDIKQRLLDEKASADVEVTNKKKIYDDSLSFQNTKLDALKSAASALESAYEGSETTTFIPYFYKMDNNNIYKLHSFSIGSIVKTIPDIYGKYYAETGKASDPASLVTSDIGIYGNPTKITVKSTCSLPGTISCLYGRFFAVSPFSSPTQFTMGVYPEYRGITSNTSIKLLSKRLQYKNYTQSSIGTLPFFYIDGVPYPSLTESFTTLSVQTEFPDYNDIKIQTLNKSLNDFIVARNIYDTAVAATNTANTNYQNALTAQTTANSNLAANPGTVLDQINTAKEALTAAINLISQRANEVIENETLVATAYSNVKQKADILANALDLAETNDFIGNLKNQSGLAGIFSLKGTDRSFNTGSERPWDSDIVVWADSIEPDTTTLNLILNYSYSQCGYEKANIKNIIWSYPRMFYGVLPPGPYPLYPGIFDDAFIRRVGKRNYIQFNNYNMLTGQCTPYEGTGTMTGKVSVSILSYPFSNRAAKLTQSEINNIVAEFPSYNDSKFINAENALIDFINTRYLYNLAIGNLNIARANYTNAVAQKAVAETALSNVYITTGFTAYQNAEKARLDYLRSLQVRLLINLYPPYEWYRTPLYPFNLSDSIQTVPQNEFRPKDILECGIEAYKQELLVELDKYIRGPYSRKLPQYSQAMIVPNAYIDSIESSIKFETQNQFIYKLNLIEYDFFGNLSTRRIDFLAKLKETFNCTTLIDSETTRPLISSNPADVTLLTNSTFTPFPAIVNPPFTRIPADRTLFRFTLKKIRNTNATQASLTAIQFFKGDSIVSMKNVKAFFIQEKIDCTSILTIDPSAAKPVTTLSPVVFTISSTSPATILIYSDSVIDADSFSFMTGPDSYEDPVQWLLEKSEGGVWKTVHNQATDATYPDYAWWRLPRTPFVPTTEAPTPLPQNQSRLKSILESGIQPNDYRIVKALSDYVYGEMSKTMPGYSQTQTNIARRYLSGLLSYRINNHDDQIVYRPKIHEVTASYTVNKYDVDTTTTQELTVRFQRNVESRLTFTTTNPITNATKGTATMTPFPVGDLVNQGQLALPFAWGGYPETFPTYSPTYSGVEIPGFAYRIVSAETPLNYNALNFATGVDREGLAQICSRDPTCIGFYDNSTGTGDAQKGGFFIGQTTTALTSTSKPMVTINGQPTPRIYLKPGNGPQIFNAISLTVTKLRSSTATDLRIGKLVFFRNGKYVPMNTSANVIVFNKSNTSIANTTAKNLVNLNTSDDFVAPFATFGRAQIYCGQWILADSFVLLTSGGSQDSDPVAWSLTINRTPNSPSTAVPLQVFQTKEDIIPTTNRYQYYPVLPFDTMPATSEIASTVPTAPENASLTTYTSGKTLEECQTTCTNPNVILNIRNSYLAANPQLIIGVTGGGYDAQRNECVLEIVKTTTGIAERIGYDFDLIYGDCTSRVLAKNLTGTLNPSPNASVPIQRLSNPDLASLAAGGYPIVSFTKIRFRPLALAGGGTAAELGKLLFFNPSNAVASFSPLGQPVATILSPSGTDAATAQTLLTVTNLRTSWKDSGLGSFVITLSRNLGASFTLFTGGDPKRAPKRWILEGTKDDHIWYTLWDQSQADDEVPTAPYSAYRRFFIDGTNRISSDLPAITEKMINTMNPVIPGDAIAFLTAAQAYLASLSPPVNFLPVQYYADTTTNKVTYKLRDNRIVELWFYINVSNVITGAYTAKVYAASDPYPTTSWVAVTAGRIVDLTTACTNACGNGTVTASARTVYQAYDFRTDPTEQPKSYPFEVGSYAFDQVQNQCIYTLATANLPPSLSSSATPQVAIPFLATLGATSCGSTALGSLGIQAAPTSSGLVTPTATATTKFRYLRFRNLQTRNPVSPAVDVRQFFFFNYIAPSNSTPYTNVIISANGTTGITGYNTTTPTSYNSSVTVTGLGSKQRILFDFGSQITNINAYSFITNTTSSDSDPVSWIFEGSLDGITWLLLDQKINWPSDTTRNCRMPIWYFSYMNKAPDYLDSCSRLPVSLKECQPSLTESAVLADALAQITDTNVDPTLNRNIITASSVNWATNEVIFRTEDGTQPGSPMTVKSVQYSTAKLSCMDPALLTNLPKTYGPTTTPTTFTDIPYQAGEYPLVIRIRFPKPPGSSATTCQLSRIYFFTQGTNATIPNMFSTQMYIQKSTFPSNDLFTFYGTTINDTSFTLNYDTTYILQFNTTVNTLRGLSLITGSDPSQAPSFIKADYSTDGKVYKTLLPIQSITPPNNPYMSYSFVYFDGTPVALPAVSTYTLFPNYNTLIEITLSSTFVYDAVLSSALSWCQSQSPAIAFIPTKFSIDTAQKKYTFLLVDNSLLEFTGILYRNYTYRILTGRYYRPNEIGNIPLPTNTITNANLKFLQSCTTISSTQMPPASVLNAASQRLKQEYPGSEFVATSFGIDSARNRVYFKLDDLYAPPLLQGLNVGIQYQPAISSSCPTVYSTVSPIETSGAPTMNPTPTVNLVNMRYFRFRPTLTRDPNAPSVRFERFSFFTADSGGLNLVEPLQAIYDSFVPLNRMGSWTGVSRDIFGQGDSPNPFLDTNKKAIEFISSTNTTNFFGYSFTTSRAANSEGSDPISWTFEASQNGILWQPIDTVTNATIPTARGCKVNIFMFDTYERFYADKRSRGTC